MNVQMKVELRTRQNRPISVKILERWCDYCWCEENSTATQRNIRGKEFAVMALLQILDESRIRMNSI